MKKNSWLLVAAVLLSLSMVLFAGCDEDSETITNTTIIESKPFVKAIIGLGARYKAEDYSSQALVQVSNFSIVPGVMINGGVLPVNTESTIYGGGIGFVGEYPETDDFMANLVVGFGEGSETGTASIIMPGTSEEIGDTEIQMVDFEGIEVSWTTAERAEKYMVIGYFEGNYVDQDDENQNWFYQFSLETTDTTLTIAASHIWPPEADVLSISNIWGDLDVLPVTGPTTPGEAGNVTGSCQGVMVGYGHFLDWDLNYNPLKQDPEFENREADLDWPVRLMEMISPR